MKAYWINASDRTISEVEYHSVYDIHKMLNGCLELAKMWPSGDTLYVDEDGKFKPPLKWFEWLGHYEPFTGNGVIVGKEINDTPDTADPTLTLRQVRQSVRFLTPLVKH